MAMSKQYITDEYTANLKAIEEEFPAYRVLTKKQMVSYLGFKTPRALEAFGIDGKLTRESFAMRLTKGRKDN